jgi:exo-1,4-beta-D-glucosaminidase
MRARSPRTPNTASGRGLGRRIVKPTLAVALALVLVPSAAAADTHTLGLGGWRVVSSAATGASGEEISQPSFSPSSWLPVKPDDAGAVGTEVGALVQNNKCPAVFFSTNMANCFGYMSHVGPDTIPQFAVPWWFRTAFPASPHAGRYEQLIINGVVGQADVWLNGSQVATQATVQGAFTRYAFDVSNLLKPGVNTLALEVHPNDSTKMFTLDNVDWTQIPPDNNTGIQFPIQLHSSGALSLSDAHVSQQDASDLSSAALTLKARLTNNSESEQTGAVSATVTPPGGGQAITVARPVTLPAGATRDIVFTPGENKQLNISHPQVWWPYQLGSQPLYGLQMSVSPARGPSDSQSETFGIRTITSSLVGPSPIAPDGARVFAVNGRRLEFRGGGWAEDLFLRYSSARITDQIALIKNLGLNGIRTEGKEMPADFYEQMDRAGLMIDAGFQCCDNWQREEEQPEYTPHELSVIHLSSLAIGRRLRNHPSILNYSWSDNAPTPGQETVALRGFAQADFQDPLIASAEYKSAPKLGPAGEKEGPYDWVPPTYWYDSTHYDATDPTRTNVGGAWAFNSESSAGATIPTLDSLQRFASPYEQAQLWQAPDYNQYHLNYEPELPGPQNFGYSFGTLHDLDQAISGRYGSWSSLNQYLQEAQVANYETQRAQFEAYIEHANSGPTPSTGLVYWQLNKGWPTMLWDLYNYEYDQAGSYFGAQKANAPLHVIYTYDTGSVSISNLSSAAASGLEVDAKVYDTSGNLLDHQTAGSLSVAALDVKKAVLTPKVPPATTPPVPAQTYFVELTASRGGALLDRNVYWLSTQADQVNWAKTLGKPQATMTRFADLSALQGLAAAKLSLSASSHAAPGGPDGSDTVTEVTVKNTSTKPVVGFFLRADVRRGSGATPAAGDNQVLPVFWSENDVTLWPGESQKLTASYRASALKGESAVVSVSGWNTPTRNVAAP